MHWYGPPLPKSNQTLAIVSDHKAFFCNSVVVLSRGHHFIWRTCYPWLHTGCARGLVHENNSFLGIVHLSDSPGVEAALESECVSKMFLPQCERLKRWLLWWVRSVGVSCRWRQCQALMSQAVWIICCNAFWSVKCQTEMKIACLKFPEPKVFCCQLESTTLLRDKVKE